MDKYISDYDLSRFNLFLRGNTGQSTFYSINNLPPLDLMFGGQSYYAVLFKEWPGEVVGHWVLLTKISDDHYEYFDCLGEPPPEEVLSLLESSGIDVRLDYTTTSLMNPKGTICGKWCMFRLMCLPNNLQGFLKFFKKFSGTPDSVVDFVVNIPVDEETF